MIDKAFYTARSLMLIVCICALVTPAQAIEWKDLWSTKSQRAQRQLDKQDFETLIEQAPNSEWRGLGEYAKGDYAKAASSFAQEREVAEQAGEIEDRIRATYNQATALMQDAKYQEALSLYDEILAAEPEHSNALHNRDIVQQLIEQQEQEQESEQGDSEEQQDGEPSDEESSEGEGGEEGEDGEQSSEQENGEPSDEQSNDNENDGVSDFEEADQAQSPEQSDEEAAEAAQAMQAEQERELTDAEAQALQNAQTGVDAAPLTEREQTNEQLLRQIPDDPVGLLERKIENRHLTDFPKVEDSDQPW